MIVAFIVIIIIILLLIILYWWFFSRQNNTTTIIKPDVSIETPPILSPQYIIPSPHINSQYKGNIDNKIDYINSTLKDKISPINIENGHTELSVNDNKNKFGIPFNRTNISAPSVLPYKELNKSTIDFDEQNTYQGLGRNDPYRPINGIMNRQKMIDPYIRDELDKEEKKQWWGNGEV